MHSIPRVFSVACALGAVWLATACGDDVIDEITNRVTCADVCSRYRDCFQSDLDVRDCTERCEDEADASENHEERLERCDDCMDEESCTSAIFECTADCVGLVP